MLQIAMRLMARTEEVGARNFVVAGLSGPETHGKVSPRHALPAACNRSGHLLTVGSVHKRYQGDSLRPAR